LTSGTGALQLTLVGNTVTMSSSASQNGVTVAAGAGGAAAALCLNPSANIVTAAGTGTATDGIAVEQLASASTFAIEGLSSGADISTVEGYLTSVDGMLLGAGGGTGAFAEQTGGNTTGFTVATCLTPAYNI